MKMMKKCVRKKIGIVSIGKSGCRTSQMHRNCRFYQNRNVKKLLLHNTDISLRRKIGANYVKRRECRGLLSGVVLSAYAEIIGRWSKRKDFCIDITILNRPSIHSQINEIVGDFTEVDILEISPEYPSNFVERTRKFKISYGKILVTAHLPVLMYCGKLTGKAKRKLLFRLYTQAQWERLIPNSRKLGVYEKFPYYL